MASASAEIEIVSSEASQSTQQQQSGTTGGDPPPELIVDVYSAAAYGDIEKLRFFVESEGKSVIRPDSNGYFALQWAALNNHAAAAQYIIERGGDVNATDNARQTALHWAAVRGSLEVADLLIQSGARVEAADVNGYRAVHVAAQYGQTGFLNHIIAKYGADFNVPDNDGRSPLHWAAYKGFADTIRLLLFRDAYTGGQDREGCTPLHWAAIRGNLEVCTVLVHASNKHELSVKDNSGFTPAQLASDKGHRHLAYILSNATKRSGNSCDDKLCAGRLAKIGYAPFLFSVIIILIVLFMNSVLFAPNIPKVTAGVGLWSWFALSLAFGAILMFYRCSSKDPGFIKPNLDKSGRRTAEDDPLLDIDLNHSSVWSGNWSQLCPSCKIIRPLRSKHCPTCKHCVEQFDHHCPWISNCVGKKNKWDFFIFLCMGTSSLFLAAAVALHRIWMVSSLSVQSSETWVHHMFVEHKGAVAFLIMDVLLFCGAFALTVAQVSQIARNITTNELANASRYAYLRGPEGRLRNPYNHGCRRNCTDFLVYGHTSDDEIVWPSLQQVAR